ncbi:beta subunit of N-acylethanolamine-hydrolyzing acid amidase-domain-containing protein [Echria macrotheca]|uniref:ceramidase n=1 Tax=Echria macrotheca TaxID=438768 RepID=A0AAJ0BKX6_9PEZI|nr:beta subunit of N-acylethanolamine-hydrolyzing acid amidase-domain-containing protein [Echria macrotheca]
MASTATADQVQPPATTPPSTPPKPADANNNPTTPADHISPAAPTNDPTLADDIPTTPINNPRTLAGHAPPRYTVNLSDPPSHRYDAIINSMRPSLQRANLPGQFTSLLDVMLSSLPRALRRLIHSLSKLILRRVHSSEQTAEIRGISRESGIPMHILVALNVLLDVLLGCTSGGVRCAGRVVHFRTLDWEMDPLRELVVEIDYVNDDKEVVASTVGYLGYVGVLTGVRRGLSVSLNYRAWHSRDTLRQRVAFRWHQAMVVLGRRPAVSSVLRGLVFCSPGEGFAQRGEEGEKERELSEQSIDEIVKYLEDVPSTAAYLILCTPSRVYSLEKDNRHAVAVHTDSYFLATCNHDVADEAHPSSLAHANAVEGMEALVEDSIERKTAVRRAWEREVELLGKGESDEEGVDMDAVVRMVQLEGISNEMTHYAVVMDSRDGKVLWRRAYEVGELGGGSESESERDSESE